MEQWLGYLVRLSKGNTVEIQCVFAVPAMGIYEPPNYYNGFIYTLHKEQKMFWDCSSLLIFCVKIQEIEEMCLQACLPYMGIGAFENDIQRHPFNQQAFDGAMGRLSRQSE